MRFGELIQNSNVLLAIIIGIIVLFLIICIIIFYNAFYPDGIPQHLKEDQPDELCKSDACDSDEEKKDMMKEGEDGMMEADMNGNGTQLEGAMME